MSNIVVWMKDGTKKEFVDRGAPGGSYCNHLKYEGAFVIIEDPYGKKTSIPAQDIEQVVHESERRSW